jgi:hypothetical protein
MLSTGKGCRPVRKTSALGAGLELRVPAGRSSKKRLALDCTVEPENTLSIVLERPSKYAIPGTG